MYSSQKGIGRKNTTLNCTTRMLIQVYLKFKQRFDSMSNRLGLQSLKLSSRKVTETQTRCTFEKFILTPCMFHKGLAVSFRTIKT